MANKDKYDAIVVGGGHAGTEAASVLSRMGHKTLLVTQDKPGKNKDNEGVVFCLSATSKEGVDELVDHLKKYFGSDLSQEETYTARRRHLSNINQAHDFFASAAEQINNNQTTDLVAEELLLAQNAISEITGEFTNEDLLEKIFSRFCIGK